MPEADQATTKDKLTDATQPVTLAEIAVRKRLLAKLAEVLRREKSALRAALFSDMALPEAEFLLYEYQPVMETLRMLIRNLSIWSMEPAFSFRYGRRRLVPRGAALIDSGDREPLAETLIPVAGAIAAGCPVTLALSSAHQSTVMKIAEILSEVFPPEVLTCSNSDFSALLQNNYAVIYPGGNAFHLRLAKDCAAHRENCAVIEVSQKLVPAIVDESAPVRRAARCIAQGKFRAAGQSRFAPDFVLVHTKVKEAFELELRKALRKFYGDNPQKSPDYARIAGRTHYETLCALMNEGNLVTGGECAPDELYIAPTVIEGAARDGALVKAPVYGPILPVFEYETFFEAMEYIKSRGVPPAVYFFGHSRHKEKRLAESVAMPVLAVNSIPPCPLSASPGKVRDLLEAFSQRGAYAKGGNGYGVFHPPFSRWKIGLLHLFGL